MKELVITVRNTFLEDCGVPLDEVQRTYLRRGVLILITPMLILFGIISGVIELVYDMYKDCW